MSEVVSGFVSDAVNVSKNYTNIPRNHRTVEVGRGILEVHSHPLPYRSAWVLWGCSETKSCFLLKISKGRSLNVSGQPMPVLSHSRSTEVLPDGQKKTPACAHCLLWITYEMTDLRWPCKLVSEGNTSDFQNRSEICQCSSKMSV